MSSRHYYVDDLGQINLVGLTAEETLEFEFLSYASNGTVTPRLADLHDKHRRATVQYLSGRPITPAPALAGEATEPEAQRVKAKPTLLEQKRGFVGVVALIASLAMAFAIILS